jgi:sugar fermentation stimulation protein A
MIVNFFVVNNKFIEETIFQYKQVVELLNTRKTTDVRTGLLINRINRFLAEVQFHNQTIFAFVPNPGRMLELMVPGKKVFLRENPGSHRKTDYDLIAVYHKGLVVSIDSNLPNRFIKLLLLNHDLPIFSGYNQVISEPRIYNGRFDFKLMGDYGSQLIEVKSCTLVENGRALFPDAPTTRGARHVRHLVKAVKEKRANKAAIVFVIQRPDATVFSPNEATDPDFAQALRFANEHYVDIIPLTTNLVDWQLELLSQIPVELDYFTIN